MHGQLSPNTQAILLLTAPLLAGRNSTSEDLLSPSEYKRLAQFLRSIQSQPADLLQSDAADLLSKCGEVVSYERLRRLLDRGFLLSQAVERWQSRALWVISRADAIYPRRFKSRLKEEAPPILYGCGEQELLDSGGLAVVGSRRVSDSLVSNTEMIGRNAAKAHCMIISGGAKGIDRAAMSGALEAGGKVTGVLAEGLERAALNRGNRDHLMDGRLVLVSPYDPQAGFNVGHAMQRNKLIYAFADAALVMNSDYEAGGTWAGAVEQLDKLHFVPIYVRSRGEENRALLALREKGAFAWPNPSTSDSFREVVKNPDGPRQISSSSQDPNLAQTELAQQSNDNVICNGALSSTDPSDTAAKELYMKVREISLRMTKPMTEAEFAEHLGVSRGQAKDWLKRLTEEGALAQLKKPLRYFPESNYSLLE